MHPGQNWVFNGFLLRQIVRNKRFIGGNEFEDDPAWKKHKTKNLTREMSDVSEPNAAELPSAVKTHQKVTPPDLEEERLA